MAGAHAEIKRDYGFQIDDPAVTEAMRESEGALC